MSNTHEGLLSLLFPKARCLKLKIQCEADSSKGLPVRLCLCSLQCAPQWELRVLRASPTGWAHAHATAEGTHLGSEALVRHTTGRGGFKMRSALGLGLAKWQVGKGSGLGRSRESRTRREAGMGGKRQEGKRCSRCE